MEKGLIWTKNLAVETLLHVIESGTNHEILSATRLLNAMYGFNAPDKNENDNTFEGKIEIEFIGTNIENI